MRCREVEGLSLGDGVVRIFLNTRGENDNEVNPELIELLHYIEHTNTIQEESICSEKVREIKRRVDKIKSSEEYVCYIETLCRKQPNMTDEEIALECLRFKKEN